MSGVGRGRGRGRGRIIDKVAEKIPEEKDPPINFRMGGPFRVGMGRGFGKKLSPNLIERAKKVQLELFDRKYYFKHYLPNAPVQGHFGPPPNLHKEQSIKKARDHDPPRRTTKKSSTTEPRGMRPREEVDPELEENDAYLQRMKQEQKKRERARHEQVRGFKQGTFGNPWKIGSSESDSEESEEDLEKKRRPPGKILKTRRKGLENDKDKHVKKGEDKDKKKKSKDSKWEYF